MMEVWGKGDGLPGRYPLLHHLLDAGAAASVLWEQHLAPGTRRWFASNLELSEEDARCFVALLAALHDVGKAQPCFQHGRTSPRDSSYIRHELVSYLSVPSLLGDLTRYDPVVESVPHRIGEVLGGHHGEFQPVNPTVVRTPAREPRLGGAPWQHIRAQHVDTLRGLLGNPPLPAVFPRSVAAVVTGLVILADWVASDVTWITDSQWDAPIELAARWEHTVAALRVRITGLGLLPPALAPEVSTEMMVGEPPNPLQRSLLDGFHPGGAGLLVITTSTASGKTEGAFIGARRLSEATGRPGLAVCLPTQATTNAMWLRGVAFEKAVSLATGPVTMAHSMAAFHTPYRDYCADDAALEWLNGTKRPLLAGLSVVTVDQVLIAALATRHNMVRLWALTGKVLVLDEVHAYEPYMLALLARILSWCGHLGVPVVLLSATLPRHITHDLTRAYLTGADPRHTHIIETPDYPGWLFTGADGTVQRPTTTALAAMRTHRARSARIEHVRYPPGQRKAVIERYAVRAAAEHGCVAVICSTVDSAQATYQHLRAQLPDDIPVTLLHSRFPYAQRSAIENDVVTAFDKHATVDNGRRPVSGIVVSTQIIEQSLDIDFDLVISDLAPIALLIQRLGRCWRHPRPRRPPWLTAPTLIVLDPLLDTMPPAWCAIYPEYELLATRRVLSDYGPDLDVPGDVDRLVQRVHDSGLPPIDGDAADAWRAQHATTARHRALAGYVSTPPPHLVDDLARVTRPNVDDVDVATRLGVDTTRLIPQYRDDDGGLWLDPAHTVAFPTTRPRPHHIPALINASLLCPASWAQDLPVPPARWGHPLLRTARILPGPEHGDLRLDPVLGLVKEGQPRDDL
jgi:CRISPR-associated endonuclease/helicase Cas3